MQRNDILNSLIARLPARVRTDLTGNKHDNKGLIVVYYIKEHELKDFIVRGNELAKHVPRAQMQRDWDGIVTKCIHHVPNSNGMVVAKFSAGRRPNGGVYSYSAPLHLESAAYVIADDGIVTTTHGSRSSKLADCATMLSNAEMLEIAENLPRCNLQFPEHGDPHDPQKHGITIE